jgi:hypothetical protein
MSALLTYLSAFSTSEPISTRLTAMRKINVPSNFTPKMRFVQDYDPITQYYCAKRFFPSADFRNLDALTEYAPAAKYRRTRMTFQTFKRLKR